MENNLFKLVHEFKSKYPFTVAWRLNKNTAIGKKFLDNDEIIHYAFVGQLNEDPLNFFTTAVIIITSKRILISRKRVLWGYQVDSITPDMYNDLTIKMGLLWGKICIDTIKEVVVLSNIQKSALPEIENAITNYIALKKNINNKL